MVKIFLIHGAFGHPEENWFPWLKSKLESQGHEVIAPTFPTPDNQSLETWTHVFKKYVEHLNEETLFVGHSLAAAFILSILEQLNHPIKACFFVSGFLQLSGNKTVDALNKSFVKKEFDWDTIKRNCSYFYVYHSDNDPHVPLEHAHELAKNLGVDAKIVKDAGHFNEAAGFTKFEQLFDDVENFL